MKKREKEKMREEVESVGTRASETRGAHRRHRSERCRQTSASRCWYKRQLVPSWYAATWQFAGLLYR